MKFQNLVAALTLSFSLALTPTIAYKGKFPGKGKPSHWREAARVFDKSLDFEDAGKPELAIEACEQAIKIYPYDPDFYANLALLYAHKKHNFAKAESLLRTAVSLAPSDVSLRGGLVGALIDQKKLPQARQQLVQLKAISRTQSDKDKAEGLERLIREASQNGR